MEYREFRELIRKLLQDMVGDQARVHVQEVFKNNETTHYGINIWAEGCLTSPLIYLEPFYSGYLQGADIGALAEQILKIYEQEALTTKPDVDALLSLEQMKDRLRMRLVGRQGNETYLEALLHWPFMDLELLCTYPLEINGRNGEVLLRKDMLEGWGVTELEFWKTVLGNMKPPEAKLYTMDEVIKGILQASDWEHAEQIADGFERNLMEVHDSSFFVLTTKDKHYGAVAITDRKVLADARRAIGEDYLVLPCSVHECLLLPESCVSKEMRLHEMVREINANHLEPEEVLGDTIYRYRMAVGMLEYYVEN